MVESSTLKSTIVRPRSRQWLSIAHGAFAAAERFAPDLGARSALRLWLKPPRMRPGRSPSAPPDLPPGEKFTVDLATAPHRPRGRAGRVVAEAWGTGGPVVYLLHGWGGTRSHLTRLVPPLLAAGMRVVALDAPAHGESGSGHLGGRRTTLPEIAAALTAVMAVAGPAHAMVSHSGGCCVAGLAVIEDAVPVDRLVFLAPMADAVPPLDQFAATLGLGPRTHDRFRRHLTALVGDLGRFDLPARAASAGHRLPPLLVIHDRDDRDLPHAHGQALADAWPDATLVTTSGLGHRRLLGDAEVINRVTSYVTGVRA
jgi:pimeloyl-ACP methyl ester carboxylesterase